MKTFEENFGFVESPEKKRKEKKKQTTGFKSEDVQGQKKLKKIFLEKFFFVYVQYQY